MRFLSLAFVLCSLLMISCGNEKTAKTTGTDTATLKTVAAAPLKPQSKLSNERTSQLMDVTDTYYKLKDALVATNESEADQAASKLISSTEALRNHLKNDSVKHPELILHLDTVLKQSIALVDIKDDKSCEKKRVPFETISTAMYGLLRDAELKHAGVYHQYCPMAFNDKGAYWLSNTDEIRNPYFGKKMLSCGEVTDSIK